MNPSEPLPTETTTEPVRPDSVPETGSQSLDSVAVGHSASEVVNATTPPALEASAVEEAAPIVDRPSETSVAPQTTTEATAEIAPTPPTRHGPLQPIPAVPPAPQPQDLSRIAQDLQIRKNQVEAVVQLLDEENTVPFITRYRKERTGGLNEEVIRRIQERVASLRALADRKHTILKSIAYHGRLTDELTQAILAAELPKRLEDLYLPYKPKKKSKATEAREKGLGPLAEAIWTRDPAVAKLDEVLPGLVDPDKWLLHTDDVLGGVKDILAEMVADSADVRGPLRNFIWDVGLIAANKVESLPEGKGKEYEPYANFKEPVRDIPPHRVLAINRGEKANVLRVHLDIDRNIANEIAVYHLNIAEHPHRELMLQVVQDALERLILPSLDREVRRELTERAQDHAVLVFAKNLRSLLLQPPLRGRKVLAIDPGIRTGCKLAVLDETGKLIEEAVIYPHGQKRNATQSKRKLEQLVRKYQIAIIAIGNGTGCRETEQLVADLIADLEQHRLNPLPSVTIDPAPVANEVASPTPSDALETTPSVSASVVISEVTLPTTDTPPVISENVQPLADDRTLSSATITADTMSLSSSMTVTSEVLSSLATVETTGTPAPSAQTLTTEATAPVPLTPPAPPVPEISLDGLDPAPVDLAYIIVIEAGASDYSASPVAREEFPTLDATTRGTISIGRRLQDPLAELVKIDPQHIGVGLYQHDVKPKHLKESLEGVIESCVNQVGVELNTASVPLLKHVSGLNQLVARSIVDHREKVGPFSSREQLLQVSGLGEKRFTQAAGFLKIGHSSEPLDSTWIHPESYPIAREILTSIGFSPADLLEKSKLEEIRSKLGSIDIIETANRLKTGEPTVRDILDALAKPGRDPREDLPPPIFKKGVLKLEDITQGMELKGTVLNVVPFGAFVDIGLKESGLVHISQMANRYIKSPYDVVSVGDVVSVWVIDVKAGEKKISLSMISPGQERRPPERMERGRGPGGPPRGAGPGGPPAQQGYGVERGDRERPPLQPRGDHPPRQQPPRGDSPPYQPRGGGAPQQNSGQQGGPPRQFNRGPGGRGPGPGNQPQRPPVGAGRGPNQPQGNQLPPGGTADAPAQQSKPQPPQPPRKPPRPPKPLPNLTGDKKTGKAPLNTFAELAAFFTPKVEPDKSADPKPESVEKKPDDNTQTQPPSSP